MERPGNGRTLEAGDRGGKKKGCGCGCLPADREKTGEEKEAEKEVGEGMR